MSLKERIQTNQIYWIAGVFILIVYIVLRINLIEIPLDRDEGGWAYNGQQIVYHSAILYKDLYDHRGPVVSYLYALAVYLFPDTASGIHLFFHIYNFLTLIALFLFSFYFFESISTALWVAFVYAIFSSNPEIQGFTASNEIIMLLPTVLTLLFSVLSVNKKNPTFVILSGFMGALSCWTRVPAFFIVLFSFIYILLSRFNSRQEDKKVRLFATCKTFLLWMSGGIGCTLMIFIYFYWQGALINLLEWNFVKSVHYNVRITLLEGLSRYIHRLWVIYQSAPLILTSGICTILLSVYTKDKRVIFLLGLLLFSLLTVIPLYGYPHYFAQLSPIIAILGGYGFSCIINCLTEKRKELITCLLVIFLLFVPIWIHSGYYFTMSPQRFCYTYFGTHHFPVSIQLADYILKNTTPEDRIFIFGSESQVLFYANRQYACSGLSNVYAIMQDSPWCKDMQEKMFREIEDVQPKYIIFVNNQMSILWDGKDSTSWFIKKLMALTKRQYILENTFDIPVQMAPPTMFNFEIHSEGRVPLYAIYRLNMDAQGQK